MANNILLITAMDIEYQAVLERINSKLLPKKKGQLFLLKSGIGNLASALNLQQFLLDHKIDLIVLLGVGGALDEHLSPGDLVLATEIIKHDALFIGESTRELMAPGELFLSLPQEKRPHPPFFTSSNLSKELEIYLKKHRKDENFFSGKLLSGDSFIANRKYKEELRNLTDQVLMVDMEAAGVAFVAKRWKIPLVVAKTVADRFRPEQKEIAQDYRDYLPYAAFHSGLIVQGIQELWLKD